MYSGAVEIVLPTPPPRLSITTSMAFAHLFDDSLSITEKLLADPDFRTADTDARFAKLFTALSSRAAVLYTFDQVSKGLVVSRK